MAEEERGPSSGTPGKGLAAAWALRPLALAALGLALGIAGVGVLGGALAAPAVALALMAAGVGLGLSLGRPALPRLGPTLFLLGLSAGLWRGQGLALELQAGPGPARTGLRLQARLASDEGARLRSGRHVFVLDQVRLLALPSGDWEPYASRLRASVDLGLAQGWLPGDRVELYGTLRSVAPPDNPGEFDFRAYLLGRGVAGSFSARVGWPARRIEPGPGWTPRRLAEQARRWLVLGLAAGLSERGLQLARGIVLGDKAGLEREDLSEYARSGFADLLAVSGTHFTLALGLFLLGARLLTHSRRRQAAAGLILGLAYALITGFEAPVQRAFALFAVWLLARLWDLECEALVSLAFGGLLILLVQPGSLFEPGFQLSFACALAVLTLGPAVKRALPAHWPGGLRAVLGTLLAAQVALAPLLAFHFHQLCWPGLAAALVSGLFTAGILGLGLPLALLGGRLPGAALVLGWPLERLLRVLDASANWLSRLPGAAYSSGLPSKLLLLGFLAWALAFLAYRGPWRRLLLSTGIATLASLLVYPGLALAHQHSGLTKCWMLDVGQGDSLLLEFEDGRCLLVDGGPAKPDAGAWVVVPALRALGIQRLQWVVATHADADHVGGLAWVLDQVPCGELLVNGQASHSGVWRDLLASAERRGVPLRALRSDYARAPSDGPWTVLAPLPPARRTRRLPKRPDTNAASVVLRVGDWLLLAGDLPKKGESKLLKRGLAPTAVLKVGHHGSQGATSAAWVAALRPAHALFSCGPDNRFGHPHAKVLAALRRATPWRTDLQGCVLVQHNREGRLSFEPWRPASAAFLRQPRPRLPSPWRRLKGEQDQAWQASHAAQEEDPEDKALAGDAS